MRRTRPSTRILAGTLAAMILATSGVASASSPREPSWQGSSGDAVDVRCGDLSLSLPEDWEALPVTPSRGVLARWSAARRDGALAPNVTVAATAGYTAVLGARLGELRREVERSLERLRTVADCRVRDARVVDVAGIPAYRLRLSLERPHGSGLEAVEQLVYIIGARSARVLTFSAPREAYALAEPEFERVVASARVDEGPLFAMPAWFSLVLLGSFAGAGGAVRAVWLSVVLRCGRRRFSVRAVPVGRGEHLRERRLEEER